MIWAISFFFFVLLFPLLTFAFTCGDITLPHPAQRIISLAPDLTENVFAIGAGKQIVGVERNSDYPVAAKSIQRVGSYTGLDTERIIAMHPDLIITWGQTFGRQLALIKQFGIPVWTAQYQQLADVPRVLQQLGCLTGHVAQAQTAAQHFNQQWHALAAQYARYPVVRVFYQLNSRPLMTINQQSWISDVITLCRGNNIFANASLIAPIVDIESVLQAKPDVIIGTDETRQWQQAWMRWQTIPAVKNKAIYALNPSLIERASPRVLLGAQQICQYLHS